MKIEIKEQNYKQLVQCVYLGNLVINEYRKAEESKKEYSNFLDDILMQIVKAESKAKAKFELKAIPYEKTEDNLLADLHDRIEDSIKEYYEYYCRSLFEEMLIDKLRI